MFEIPIELVHNIVGYRFDEPSGVFDGRFVVLDAIDPTLMQLVRRVGTHVCLR
ncbi:MAG TPA: hypothetical protein VM096_07480 [Vicinamibacterales bacterium]|nr:hypothetical protein [Vicinamibacterales bacterium]